MEYWHVPLIIMKNPKQQDRTDRYIILRGDNYERLLHIPYDMRYRKCTVRDGYQRQQNRDFVSGML